MQCLPSNTVAWNKKGNQSIFLKLLNLWLRQLAHLIHLNKKVDQISLIKCLVLLSVNIKEHKCYSSHSEHPHIQYVIQFVVNSVFTAQHTVCLLTVWQLLSFEAATCGLFGLSVPAEGVVCTSENDIGAFMPQYNNRMWSRGVFLVALQEVSCITFY